MANRGICWLAQRTVGRRVERRNRNRSGVDRELSLCSLLVIRRGRFLLRLTSCFAQRLIDMPCCSFELRLAIRDDSRERSILMISDFDGPIDSNSPATLMTPYALLRLLQGSHGIASMSRSEKKAFRVLNSKMQKTTSMKTNWGPQSGFEPETSYRCVCPKHES